MKKINRNLYPPGGYIFQENDGTELRASTWDALVAVVVKYRAANGFQEGDPWKDITEQACKRSPSICTEASPHTVYPKNKHSVAPSLKSRVIRWLTEIAKARRAGQVELTTRETARNRRAICLNCPKKQAYQGGCAPCGAALKALRHEAVGFDPDQPGMGGCEPLGADIAVLANLNLTTQANADLPDACWMKKTI